MTDSNKNDEKSRTQRCIYFSNQNQEHQRLLSLMSGAGSRGGSAKLLEMAQVGAIFEEQKVLQSFLGVADSHGVVKALEMVLMLLKDESSLDESQAIRRPLKQETPSKASDTSKPVSRSMGMFSPQSIALDD